MDLRRWEQGSAATLLLRVLACGSTGVTVGAMRRERALIGL